MVTIVTFSVFFIFILVFLIVKRVEFYNDELSQRITDLRKKVRRASTEDELFVVWQEYQKLKKDAWHESYTSKLDNVCKMINKKLNYNK